MGDSDHAQSRPRDGQRPTDGDGDGADKGKGPATKPSALNRLQASGKLALNAVATSSDAVPDMGLGQKAAAGPSTAHRPPPMLGEASAVAAHQAAGVGESLRTPAHLQASSSAFDSFMGESPDRALLAQGRRPGTTCRSVAEQEASDGAAVVQLLSLPDDAANALPPQDDDDDGLFPAEAARLREALFGTGNAGDGTPWGALLDFTPDFVALPGAASSTDARLYVGTADVDTAESIWLQQWSDVLSRYTADVWGDLGPLATEARREVDQLSLSGSRSSEAKALRRLGLVLAHVRGSGRGPGSR